MSVQTKLRQRHVALSKFEAHLINKLQDGLPLKTRPFDDLAEQFDTSAQEIMRTIEGLFERGVITRFGPLFNIEKIGGVFSLCALKVPASRFDDVAMTVNSYPQVAHNYEREHEWNMWFVLATQTQDELLKTYNDIISRTGCEGMNLPKQEEFFVGLKLHAQASDAQP